MTLNKIIEELRVANPEPFGQTNGEKYKMEGAELEAYYADSAKIILEQNAKEVEASTKAASKAALLDRLGMTADEAKLLLS